MNLPKRLELLLCTVLAFPKACNQKRHFSFTLWPLSDHCHVMKAESLRSEGKICGHLLFMLKMHTAEQMGGFIQCLSSAIDFGVCTCIIMKTAAAHVLQSRDKSNWTLLCSCPPVMGQIQLNIALLNLKTSTDDTITVLKWHCTCWFAGYKVANSTKQHLRNPNAVSPFMEKSHQMMYLS